MCINRNIVECKEHDAHNRRQITSCINRNIVECKDLKNNVLKRRINVLIETLWNVKL